MTKKYEILTDEFILHDEFKLYRIRATKDFGKVKSGDLGGFIQSESNLSQKGLAWVYDDAKVYCNAEVFDKAQVYGKAKVKGNAQVYGRAQVYDNAQVQGNAWVYGNAQVYGKAKVYCNAEVFGKAQVYGKAKVKGDARVKGNAQVTGTADVSGLTTGLARRFFYIVKYCFDILVGCIILLAAFALSIPIVTLIYGFIELVVYLLFSLF